MTPTYLWHGDFQNQIARIIEKNLPYGRVIIEAAIQTVINLKKWIKKKPYTFKQELKRFGFVTVKVK